MNANQTLPRPTEEYLRNSDWIFSHIDDLVRKYPNQWVAAYRGRILAAGPGLTQVTEDAERCAPKLDIAYHFVDDGTLIY